jgi:hypothetical protein
MAFCYKCGNAMGEGDGFCKECGAPAAPSAAGPSAGPPAGAPAGPPAQVFAPVQMGPAAVGPSGITGGFMAGQVLALVGGVLLLVGPFLTWMNAVVISVSGLQKTDNEAYVLVFLGVVAAVFGLISLLAKSRKMIWVSYVAGIVGLGFSIYYYFAMRDQLGDANSLGEVVSLGAGIYLCLIGSALVFIGAVISTASKKR